MRRAPGIVDLQSTASADLNPSDSSPAPALVDCAALGMRRSFLRTGPVSKAKGTGASKRLLSILV
jgi:hypothetical protein